MLLNRVTSPIRPQQGQRIGNTLREAGFPFQIGPLIGALAAYQQ
jgi:hypothetical protein